MLCSFQCADGGGRPLKIELLWDVAPCGWAGVNRRASLLGGDRQSLIVNRRASSLGGDRQSLLVNRRSSSLGGDRQSLLVNRRASSLGGDRQSLLVNRRATSLDGDRQSLFAELLRLRVEEPRSFEKLRFVARQYGNVSCTIAVVGHSFWRCA